MNGLENYLIPYVVSQVVALLFLFAAYKNTRLARLFFGLLFIGASCLNLYTGLTSPEVYQDYAPMAIPVYRDFINGWFSYNSHVMVPIIALGKFLIGVGMFLRGWWVSAACFGAIVFLLSISPLLVGSAFPFSLIVSAAVILVLRKNKKLLITQNPN